MWHTFCGSVKKSRCCRLPLCRNPADKGHAKCIFVRGRCKKGKGHLFFCSSHIIEPQRSSRIRDQGCILPFRLLNSVWVWRCISIAPDSIRLPILVFKQDWPKLIQGKETLSYWEIRGKELLLFFLEGGGGGSLLFCTSQACNKFCMVPKW